MVKPTTTTLPDVQARFAATEQSMNNRLIERSTLTRVLLLALVGKMDVFGLGEPGIAKTLSVTTLRDHISDLPPAGYFWRLLTKFTSPSELFGPPDLQAMDEGIWRSQTDNTMVDAKFVLLDEIFKANSAILNSLLTFMNESKYHNDVVIDVDKWVVFGLSNEMPQGEELNALYDRLDFRLKIERIKSSSGFVQMLKSQHLGEITPTISVADIEQAQTEVSKVEVTDEIFDAILALRNDLSKQGVEPTDRRFARSLNVIKAAAWLRGSNVTEIDDMRDLRHTLWTNHDDKSVVDTLVLQLASPLDAEAIKLRDDVESLNEEFEVIFNDSDNKTARNKKAIDLHSKLDRAATELKDLQNKLPAGRRSEVMEDIETNLEGMTDRILRDVFSIDPTQKKIS